MSRFSSAFSARARPRDGELVRAEVGAEGDPLRALLRATAAADLSADQVRDVVDGNLWMLAPDAFRYFLPAFMDLVTSQYPSLRTFAAELVGALTEPAREDVVQALERAAQLPPAMGLAPEMLRQLEQQQLDWYDSGTPLATYEARMAGLSAAERAAVLDFLGEMRDSHGDEFPFDEPQVAIDRLTRRFG